MTALRTRLIALTAATGAITTAGIVATAVPADAHAVSRCGNALTVTRSFVDAGAGHSWLSLIYRNHTARTCTVSGYPGLDAVSRGGQVLAHASRTRDGVPLRTVTIRPGGYASAVVQWQNFDGRTGGSCRYSASARTIVANTTRVHPVAVSVSLCGLQVHPTVAGTPQLPNYGAAQGYWIAGAKSIAATTDVYLRGAEKELEAAGTYPSQVTQLAQLASFPETGLTTKQIREARADVAALNDFFATPGLY